MDFSEISLKVNKEAERFPEHFIFGWIGFWVRLLRRESCPQSQG
jgi:hypothetical protein